MRQADVFSVITERVNVGTGLVVGVSGGPNVVSISIKYLAGGTCELLGVTSQAADTGFLLGANETITLGGPATVFLRSTGATSVVMLIKSQDATLLPNL